MAQAIHKIQELRTKRAALIEQSRAIIDAADASAEKKMTADQRSTYDKIMKDVDDMKATIEAEERQAALEAEMKAQAPAPDTRQASPGTAGKEEKEKEARAAFFSFMKTGRIPDEARAMSAGTDIQGGYMVTPQTLAADILKAADASFKMRKVIKIITLGKAESLGQVTLDTDMADGEWTSEISFGTEESTVRVGKRDFKPNPLAKNVKISNKLLNSAFVNPEQFIIDRLGYKIAVALEKGYMSGTGSGQPLGIFVASAAGITTSRDKDMGAYTALTGDQLIEQQHNIREPYRANAIWAMHTDWLARIRKLKDAVTGSYLWQPGLLLNQPDTLLGKPVIESEFAPSATSSGSYAIAYGDFSYYIAVDSLAMQVQRLNELFAATNQVGFIIRYEGDGQPALAEAFTRLKVSA
jgi:HK97 family phage major capsid protein